MNIPVLILLGLFSSYALAQSDGNFLGVGYSFSAQEHSPKATDSADFRVVTNQIFNVPKSKLWLPVFGKFSSRINKETLMIDCSSRNHLKFIVLRNYSGVVTYGLSIGTMAMQVGVYEYENTPYELWDCGKPYVPPKPTLEQVKAAKEAAAEAEKKRKTEGDVSTFKWIQEQAEKGDADSQFRLGERYLTGVGVKTNRALAIEWFQKSAISGSSDASNKLAILNQPIAKP